MEEVVVGLGVGSDAQPEPEHGALNALPEISFRSPGPRRRVGADRGGALDR